jgi:predicted nucleic acid-binding protein
MNYLLDTCVLSEFTRRRPNAAIIDWLQSIDEQKCFLSVITIGEIRRGIEKLPESQRKNELFVWLNEALMNRFTTRILIVDTQTMLVWGALTARLESAGKKMSTMDAFIAASALQHNMALVTRNVSDFSSCGLQILDPWEVTNGSGK